MTNPTPIPPPAARRSSEPVSIGDALAELLPRLRTCDTPSGISGRCGKPATDGLCTYHTDERAAFYTAPKGR